MSGLQSDAREYHDRSPSVRVDITDWIPRTRQSKPPTSCCIRRIAIISRIEEVTIAEQLKTHGYQTFFAGKWHLGSEGHWPEDQGL